VKSTQITKYTYVFIRINNPHQIQHEAQLMLTTCATRLAVSQGQQT